MRELQFKKISERLERFDRSFQNLTKAHYTLMSMLVPEAKPTRREMEILKRRKGKFVTLDKLEKKIKDV